MTFTLKKPHHGAGAAGTLLLTAWADGTGRSPTSRSASAPASIGRCGRWCKRSPSRNTIWTWRW
ncbi:hypothetical protein M8494_14325 [Serratia ureilytica]